MSQPAIAPDVMNGSPLPKSASSITAVSTTPTATGGNMKMTLREFILSPRFDPILIGGPREAPLEPSEAIFCTDGSEGPESETEMSQTPTETAKAFRPI